MFTRICMRHKLITIVTDKNKRLFTQCFSSHFILIIHCYHWYQEWIYWKLWNKTALGARYHVDQCLNIKKLNINKNKWWNYTRTLILAVFFLWSWTRIFPFIKAFQSFFHACMKIIIVMFFFCLWMFTVHVICFAIEQYKNKQTREASLVMYKLLKKKKVYTWLYWTSLLQVVILWNVCQSFFHVQYLLLRKKTGTKNNFFFLLQVITGLWYYSVVNN